MEGVSKKKTNSSELYIKSSSVTSFRRGYFIRQIPQVHCHTVRNILNPVLHVNNCPVHCILGMQHIPLLLGCSNQCTFVSVLKVADLEVLSSDRMDDVYVVSCSCTRHVGPWNRPEIRSGLFRSGPVFWPISAGFGAHILRTSWYTSCVMYRFELTSSVFHQDHVMPLHLFIIVISLDWENISLTQTKGGLLNLNIM